MTPIDVDREILRTTAAASAHAYQESIIHIEAEIKAANGLYEPLINTLTPEGPYAYTILPELRRDGSVKLPILTTREEIAKTYAMIRGASDLLAVIGLTEIRGTWYTFQHNISRGRLKGSDEVSTHETLALFPSGQGPGITGELVWVRVPRSALGPRGGASASSDDPLLAREQVYDQYDRYLDALRANNVEAVLNPLHDSVASAVRDYVNDTGTLTELEGKDSHRSYYRAFFDKYEVRSVEPLSQVTEDWYVFAELRMAVARRDGEGGTVAFHTAEFFLPSNDGRFIARIGHGTGPA